MAPNPATGIAKSFRCDAEIVSSNKNVNASPLKIAFFEFKNTNAATELKTKGTPYELAVKVTNDEDASTTAGFVWKKADVLVESATSRYTRETTYFQCLLKP